MHNKRYKVIGIRRIKDITYLNTLLRKKEMSSNRMSEHNRLIHDTYYHKEYLNISVDFRNCAGMAEWSLQLFDTQCPFGVVGSIPASGVIDILTMNKRGEE